MMMGEACQSWLSAKSLVVIVGFTYKSIKYLKFYSNQVWEIQNYSTYTSSARPDVDR